MRICGYRPFHGRLLIIVVPMDIGAHVEFLGSFHRQVPQDRLLGVGGWVKEAIATGPHQKAVSVIGALCRSEEPSENCGRELHEAV